MSPRAADERHRGATTSRSAPHAVTSPKRSPYRRATKKVLPPEVSEASDLDGLVPLQGGSSQPLARRGTEGAPGHEQKR
jgi:hypothetical protein